jgi:2-C-methyl-D-erythritol 2,4-cyclodiphosphate synthase
MRIGIGYDLHRLIKGRKLFLGGVHIPFDKGLLGHSDADVLLHAVSDALLGACAKGDIGLHFPDTKKEFKDISSLKLLEETRKIINKDKVVNIINIDAIIVCDEPKVHRYADQMKKNICKALKIDMGRLNIKAKTTEKTQPGIISAYAVASVE